VVLDFSLNLGIFEFLRKLCLQSLEFRFLILLLVIFNFAHKPTVLCLHQVQFLHCFQKEAVVRQWLNEYSQDDDNDLEDSPQITHQFN